MSERSQELTAEELRTRLSQALREKGLVGSLQSQLRNVLVKELQTRDTDQGLFPSASASRREAPPFLRAANSLIVDHLKRCRYDYTLSVFVPETGDPDAKFLTMKELLAFLQISPHSSLYKSMLKKSSDSRKKGFLWQLLSEIAHLHGYGSRDMNIQTDPTSFVNYQSSLEEQFHHLDRKYSSLSDDLYTRHSVEERMLAYQRQVDERSRTEFQLECARFRDNELSRMRMEERENNRQQLDKLRREMEDAYRTKYEMLSERERHANEKLQKATEIQEREIYNQRQTLLDEIESVRQREAALRKQQEIGNREHQLWEEKIKTREQMAKHKEEQAHRLEIESTQRIQDQVNKFKIEEQGRLMERLQNVELREAKVKENERRVYDDQQDIERIKAELREKRHRVNELEAELTKSRHEAVSAERQADLLNERAKEFADHQVVKENNIVLKRQVDDLRLRIQELTKEVLVERQKNEELLREIGHVNSLPTSEVFQLRKQVEKLQGEVRQEKAFSDHKKVQWERRYQSEVERNQQLMRKYEDQTLQSREMIKEMNDYRQQLQHTKVALTNEVYRKPKGDLLNESGSVCGIDTKYSDFSPRIELPVQSPSNLIRPPATDDRLLMTDIMQEEGDSSHSFSYSTDLMQETKRRLLGLESEAANLQENFRNLQMRATSAAATALTPADMTLTSVTPTKSKVAFGDHYALLQEYSPAVAGSAVKTRGTTSNDTSRRISSTPSKLEKYKNGEYSSPSQVKGRTPDLNTTMSTIPSASPVVQKTRDDDVTEERRTSSSDPETATPVTVQTPVTSSQTLVRQPPVFHDVSTTRAESIQPSLSLNQTWKTQLQEPTAHVSQSTQGHVTQSTPGHMTQSTQGHVTQSTPAEVVYSLDDAWKTEQQDKQDQKSAELEFPPDYGMSSDDNQQTMTAESAQAEAAAAIDPMMQKYMAMVQEQRDNEKQLAKKTVEKWRNGESNKASSQSISEDISGADNNDSSFHSTGKADDDDFW